MKGARRATWMLIADGCVISAGVFSLFTGVAFLLGFSGVFGKAGSLPGPVNAIMSLLSVSALFIGPVLAWVLNGRRINRYALIGAVLGFPVGGTLVYALAFVAAGTDWLVTLATGTQFLGALVVGGIYLAVLLAAAVWLVSLAVVDMRADVRRHPRLDIARVSCVVATVAFGIGTVLFARANPGQDAFEALAFVLFAAAEGAGVMWITDVMARTLERGAKLKAAVGG